MVWSTVSFRWLALFLVGFMAFIVENYHKNGWLEEGRVTPIEARSPVKVIEPY